jgi:DNA-binding MarR family transcriptional regulator
MPTRKKSPLAVTLKQNRPFVSLQQEALLSVLRTASELSHSIDTFLWKFEITQPQYNVLRILRGAGAEGLCRNEISDRMIAATPDMSRLLERIEKSGWVTRARSQEDRRQVSTFITDAGKRLLATIEGPLHEHVALLFGNIKSGELNTLLKVLARIRSQHPERA